MGGAPAAPLPGLRRTVGSLSDSRGVGAVPLRLYPSGGVLPLLPRNVLFATAGAVLPTGVPRRSADRTRNLDLPRMAPELVFSSDRHEIAVIGIV